MNIIIGFLIFCIVLFFYLHIYFQLKTSNDLEVFEIEQPAKEKHEEVCDLRQPILFPFDNDKMVDLCNRKTISDSYPAFDVKIRNMDQSDDDTKDLYSLISLKEAIKIVEEDKEGKYLVENNNDFLEETEIIKIYKANDMFLRPYMMFSSQYDFLMASKDMKTPLRYEINFRNYFLVTEGEIKVKLSPPKSSKYLYKITDYENMEFRSPVNPWAVQPQYKAVFDKIKFIETTVKKGQILYIPPYWWYSFDFSENSSICTFKYRTFMNLLAISDKIIMKFLQLQNVKRNILN